MMHEKLSPCFQRLRTSEEVAPVSVVMEIKQEAESPPLTTGQSALAHARRTGVQGIDTPPWNQDGTEAEGALLQQHSPQQHCQHQQQQYQQQQHQHQQQYQQQYQQQPAAMCAYKHGGDELENDYIDCKRRRTVLPPDEKMARRRWQNSQAARRFREKNRAKAMESQQRQVATEQENQRLMLETQRLSLENQRLLLENHKWKTLANADVDAQMRRHVAERLQSLSWEQLSKLLAALPRQMDTHGAQEGTQGTASPAPPATTPWNLPSHPGPVCDGGLRLRTVPNGMIRQQPLGGFSPRQQSPNFLDQGGRSSNGVCQSHFPTTIPSPEVASCWNHPPLTPPRQPPERKYCGETLSPQGNVDGGCVQQISANGSFPHQVASSRSQPAVSMALLEAEAAPTRRLTPLPPTAETTSQEAIHLAISSRSHPKQTISNTLSSLTSTSSAVTHQTTEGRRQPAAESGLFQQAISEASPLTSACDMTPSPTTRGACQQMLSRQSYTRQTASDGLHSQPSTASASERYSSLPNEHQSTPSSDTMHSHTTSAIKHVHTQRGRPTLHGLQEDEDRTSPLQITSTSNGTTEVVVTRNCHDKNIPRSTSKSSWMCTQSTVTNGVLHQETYASAKQRQILIDDVEQILETLSSGFCEWLESPSDDGSLPNLYPLLTLPNNWEQDLLDFLDS